MQVQSNNAPFSPLTKLAEVVGSDKLLLPYFIANIATLHIC